MQVVGFSERATLAGVSMPLAAIRRINRKYGADADTYSSVLVRAQSADDVGEVAAGVRKLGLEIDDTERRYAVQIGAAVELVTLALSLLADEPTGNLDARTGEGVIDLFRQLHREGMTLLIVTHEARVSHAATRILVLREGRLHADGAEAMETE